MRWLLTLLPTLAVAADGYTFVGTARAYTYRTDQTVTWASAGDRLEYTTRLEWRLLFKGRSERDLAVTFLRVTAQHQGPGSDRRVDSAVVDADPDPLLGHLTALEGITLVLTVDPATGLVEQVAGTDELARRIAAAVPNRLDPSGPSPLATAARATYTPEALARLWTTVLALPQGPARLPLAPPAGGTLERTWNGTAWTARLAEGSVPVTVGTPPTDVTGTLADLTGNGSLTLDGGLPRTAQGEVSFTMRLTALTQPVESRHRMTWALTPASE